MRIMVFIMRYMTKYAPRLARVIVRQVAEREIIACGLRMNIEENPCVIYIPRPDRSAPEVWDIREKRLLKAKSISDFSDGLVKKMVLSDTSLGTVCRLISESSNNGQISSPDIYIKPITRRDDDLLEVMATPTGISISWKAGEEHKPMIYFLVIEDQEQALVGIYTRDTKWTYPDVHLASLDVGAEKIRDLKDGETLTMKLLLVDYDGWVSHAAFHRLEYRV